MSDDQKTWHPIDLDGEGRACVDKQAAAWLKERPDLAVEIDDSTCYGEFPGTFNEMSASIEPRPAARASTDVLTRIRLSE
ncbi:MULTISPECIES: hypothetical protein [Streptomyces]|uniref:Uncharacterized protein n=2 Tax=Streptomyces TaxID=1883 RepID=A0ABV9J7X2_9ACTN